MGGSQLRTVVVGASSGLGRCIGIGLAQRGARTALLARRLDRLDTAAAEAGGGTVALQCDVTSAESCHSAIAAAVKNLGGIDALVYTPTIGPLASLIDTDAETWRRVFDTNVIGAALVTAAAIPYLTDSSGTAVYLSSVSAVPHAALARSGRLCGQQGGIGQARGGVEGRASDHRIHPSGRRRMRRWCGRFGHRILRPVGPGACRGVLPALARAYERGLCRCRGPGCDR